MRLSVRAALALLTAFYIYLGAWHLAIVAGLAVFVAYAWRVILWAVEGFLLGFFGAMGAATALRWPKSPRRIAPQDYTEAVITDPENLPSRRFLRRRHCKQLPPPPHFDSQNAPPKSVEPPFDDDITI
jgi:hypothetical protein